MEGELMNGWSPSELFHEAVVVPRRAWVPLPDLEVVERPGWLQIVTPSFRQGGFNEVAHAVLDEREADAVIDRTIAGYRDRGIRFRWTVGPDSAPADLAERLARRGLVRSLSRAMVRSTAPLANLALAPGVSVEPVDAHNVEAYTEVMAAGWGADPEPLRRVHALVLGAPSSHRLTLGRVDGQPAGAAGQVLFARSTYLLGAVVLPAFRRRGLYAALVAARLDLARAAGLDLATSLARAETSAPLLERLGFQTVSEVASLSG
ncbi:MAG: GNAT family N-acetyltransferase [Deltaproteobacteria bacterium]|nr:GNAT family N-acetyltransferase [Deltaproteobacteria bacterium]